MSAIVPYVMFMALWMCGIRVVYVLSAIEPTSFLQVLETSPYRGGSAKIFYLYCCFYCFCRAGPVEVTRSTSAQRRLATAPTRHCAASLSSPPP